MITHRNRAAKLKRPGIRSRRLEELMSFIRKLREARIQAELERLYLKESMEEAERMDPE
jgi:hypothetical protein